MVPYYSKSTKHIPLESHVKEGLKWEAYLFED